MKSWHFNLSVKSFKGMLQIHHNAFGKVDGSGGLLRVGVLSSGVEPEGFVVNHGQSQHHLFGFQTRPDGRSCVSGWGSCWKQGGDSLLDDAAVRFGRRCGGCWRQGGDSLLDDVAVRFGRRWRGGVGVLSEGSGCRGSSVLKGSCCLLLFVFC